MSGHLSRRIGLDDLAGQVRLAEPRWSFDGSRVLLAVSRADLDEDTYVTEIVALDVDAKTAETWVGPRSDVRHARWSGDGSTIAVLALADSRSQLHHVARPGAPIVPLTSAPEGVRSFVVRPSGGFVYAATDPAPGPLESHNRSFEVAEHDFLATAPPRPSHLWHLRASDGARPVTWGGHGVNVEQAVPGGAVSYACSPDGETVAFLAQAVPGARGVLSLTLESVALETGRRTVHLTAGRAITAPAWDHEGSQLAVLAPRGPSGSRDGIPLFDPRGACVLHDGGLHPASPRLDRDLAGFAWLPTGDLLLWGPDGTRIGVWVQSPGEAPRALSFGDVDPVSDIAVGPDGRLAFVGVQPSWPPELFVVDRLDGAPRRITELNGGLRARERAQVETVTWAGPDGASQDGVLVLPVGFDAKVRYPLVVLLHGGPMGASTRGWVGFRQLLAARGWLVFCPNYRGSNHRGVGFQRSILGDPAVGPARDILAGIEALRSRGIVDDDRRAVTGWSYGGYLAAWLCGTSSGWAAAVAGAPVVDWRDAYALSDLGPWFGNALGGSPWERPDAYEASSPLTHLADYTTPTLILACTGDERVPITHAYRLFRALRDRGTEVLFVAYPVPGHYPAGPVHQHDLWRRWLAWLRGHLG